MKLDLSCPIELRGYALVCKDGRADATARLYNLSDRRIASFEAVAKWRSELAGRSLACPFTADALRAEKRSFFSMELTTDRLPDADSVELLFTRVRFEDGEEWRAGNGPYADVGPLPFLRPDELTRLRAQMGGDAVCVPREDGETWRCVCGRVNAGRTCVRCQRSREEAFSFTPEPEKATPSTESPAEKAEFEALQSRALRRQARRLRRALALSIVVLAAGVLAVLCAPKPAVQTVSAAQAFSSDLR